MKYGPPLTAKRHFLIALACASMILAPASLAQACTPAPGWPAKVQLDPRGAARKMAASAAYIDVVRVESLTPDYEVGTLAPEGWAVWIGTEPDAPKNLVEALQMARASWEGAARIHYRVVERLKGRSAETFAMNGQRVTDPRPPWGLQSKTARLQSLKYFLDQQDLAAWPGPGACGTEITASEGAAYLVFRDVQGGLLRTPISVVFKGSQSLVTGPANVPVTGASDPWVTLVRHAVDESR